MRTSTFVCRMFCIVVLYSKCDLQQEYENDETENVYMDETQKNLTPGKQCFVAGIVFGTWFSQNNKNWSSILLGNSESDTIGNYGCVISDLAMVYQNLWLVPTTPAQLNSSAKSHGCFSKKSSFINVLCAINSRGGPHWSTNISMANVASTICSGKPVMVDVTWGGGHKMLVYYYTGGNTTSMSSYKAIDPWDGTAKFITSYTATQWRKLE